MFSKASTANAPKKPHPNPSPKERELEDCSEELCENYFIKKGCKF
jgi:hypothetical protein